MLDSIYKNAETKMHKSLESLETELNKIRTGRAHPSLIATLSVNYYGSPTPLNQVANISVEDSRTLMVTPWDKSSVTDIEKAIMTSDLGLNPATAGTTIRVPLPPLTEERRKGLVKQVGQIGEGAKVAVRNIRRDANSQIKDLLKDKKISEDDQKVGEEKIQKITDETIKQIDKDIEVKGKELTEI